MPMPLLSSVQSEPIAKDKLLSSPERGHIAHMSSILGITSLWTNLYLVVQEGGDP